MRHRVPPAQLPPRPAEEPPPEHLLAGLSNQSVARLLSRAPKPEPTRANVKTITHLDSGVGAEEWADTIEKGKSLMPLLADLATQLGATVIRDVKGTDVKDITFALKPDRIQPGLNLVSRGIGKGRCWYIEGGRPADALTVTANGPLPQVAIGVGPAAFDAKNKAFALATVRHEIEHAAHRQMAVDWMEKWRRAGAPGDFRIWLGTQEISQVDRQLVGELDDGEVKNTEVLAHLEGFITAFPHEDHQKANKERSVYDQLRGVAANWKAAHHTVRTEAIRRIKEMKKAQKGDALTALKAAFTRLQGEPDSPKELVDAVLSAGG